jgi:hypothetical protein
VLLPFLERVRAEGGGDGAPGDALGFETGGRIVLLDAGGLGVGILLGLGDGGRLFVRSFRRLGPGDGGEPENCDGGDKG